MSIVEAVIAARAEMPQLLNDEKAKMGTYSFTYATLAGILKAVTPALLKHGVLLKQDVTSEDGVVSVESALLDKNGEFIKSGKLSLPYDRTPIDAAKKVTSMRRMQLLGLLGMAADDEEQSLYKEEVEFPNRSERQPPPPSTPAPAKKEKADPNLHKLTAPEIQYRQECAAHGQELKLVPERDHFLITMRTMDKNDNQPMPVTIREGAKASMYGYLCGLIDQNLDVKGAHVGLLSYMFGRIVSSEAPPKLGHRYLIDELRETPNHPNLKEAYDLMTVWE